MRNFLIFLDFVKRLYRSRYMLKMLTLRELRSSYVGSIFGITWAVLNPLFLVAIYGIIFGIFFKSEPDPAYGTNSYFLFLLCGLVPWQFLSQTISSSTGVIVLNLNLVKKAVGFPSEVLPIVSVITNVISHLISVALLLVMFTVFSAKFTPYILLIFVYMFFTALLCIGIGWVLSGVNVFLRDIQQVIGLVMMGWFFFTPVFYSSGIIPAWILPLMKLNPAYHLVEGYRLAILAGKPLPLGDFLYFAGTSLLVFGLGGIFFRRLKPLFAELL